MKRILFALLAAFALSGCEQLRVESIPSGEIVACATAFAGWWRVESESVDADDDEAMHLHVSDDCAQWISVETDRDGDSKREDLATKMRFDFRTIGDEHYLAVSDREPGDEPSKDVGEGYALLRYVVRADRIDLFEGDPRREAHRIADGLVNGLVRADSHAGCGADGECAVSTMISGDADAIAAWVKRFDPIDRAFMELRRVDDKTAGTLDAHLKPAATDGKPKPHE